jgi:tRNA dimethylallyltransferase
MGDLFERMGAELPIVAIVGPTATGKTATGVLLAQSLNGEIISADSMAVYRGMDIGTAKPGALERALVPIHLLDVAEPEEAFSVARFKELAEEALAGIRARRRRPIVVGGTGLYVRVLLEDFGLTQTPPDPELRVRLEAQAQQVGAPVLHARLAGVDPQAAARIHPKDRIRIVRALEVYERTGIPMSVQHSNDAERRRPRPAIKFALTASREELYRRIDARVDAMVAAGLEEEVRQLLGRGHSPKQTPLRSLGYKEMIAFLTGACCLNDAVEAIKKNTRRFAKRQLTWFRADPDIVWVDISGKTAAQTAEVILAQLPA